MGRGAQLGEAIVVTVAGAVLGGGAGWLVGEVLAGSTVLAVAGAAVGAANGAVSGYAQIYRWESYTGWLSFLADSTWALLGTVLGLVVIHLPNAFWPEAGYRSDLCRRKDFHLYQGGMRLKAGFAFTLGNAASNGATLRGFVREDFIMNHERLHVIQSRIFGPLYQLVYVVWYPLGAVVAFVVWLTDRDVSLPALVQTAGYYDNPFEYWAYRNDNHWRPGGVISKLAWPDVPGGR